MSCTVFSDRACPGVLSIRQAQQGWSLGSGQANSGPVCAHTPTTGSWQPAGTGYSVVLTCAIDSKSVTVHTPEDHRACS